MHWRDSLLMAPRSHLLEQRYRHTSTERDLGTVLSQMEELRELIEQHAPKSEKDQVRSLYLTLPYLTIPYLTLPYITLHYTTLPYLTFTLPYPALPYLYLTFTLPHLTLPDLT